MNKFEKISKEQFDKDFSGGVFFNGSSVCFSSVNYDDIKLPKRATKYSAGHDFFSPVSFTLRPGDSIKLPTGIRAILDNDKFLAIFPRSGLGFKYRFQLDNTVGIIDSDYSGSSNEGHIWIKVTNDGREGKNLTVNAGEGMAQGVCLPYFSMDDSDEIKPTRDGGLGSTTVA